MELEYARQSLSQILGEMDRMSLNQLHAHVVKMRIPSGSRSLQMRQEFADVIKSAEQKQLAAVEGSVKKMEGELGDSLLTATDPGDLDQFLTQISGLKEGLGTSAGMRDMAQKLDSYKGLVLGWQDYLAYKNAKDPKRALSQLRNVDTKLARHPLIPRSELISRRLELERLPGVTSGSTQVPPPYTVAEAMMDVSSYQDLPDAVEKLRALQQYPMVRSQVDTQLSAIDKLMKVDQLITESDPLVALYYMKGSSLSPQKGVFQDIENELGKRLYWRPFLKMNGQQGKIPHFRKSWMLPRMGLFAGRNGLPYGNICRSIRISPRSKGSHPTAR